jgi:hypothetical protein
MEFSAVLGEAERLRVETEMLMQGRGAVLGEPMARQVGTALGIAVFGAIAGSPARVPHFVSAMHSLSVAAALAWLAVIAMVLAIRPGNRLIAPGS